MNMTKEQFVELVWKELRHECSFDPEKAIRLVMVTKCNVESAMGKVWETVQNKDTN